MVLATVFGHFIAILFYNILAFCACSERASVVCAIRIASESGGRANRGHTASARLTGLVFSARSSLAFIATITTPDMTPSDFALGFRTPAFPPRRLSHASPCDEGDASGPGFQLNYLQIHSLVQILAAGTAAGTWPRHRDGWKISPQP